MFSLLSEKKRNWIRFACVSLVYFKKSVPFFRFFSLQIFRFASTYLFSLRSETKGKPFFASNISFRFKKHLFALFRITMFLSNKIFADYSRTDSYTLVHIFKPIHTHIDTPVQAYTVFIG
jgi:hypothetical protein